MRRTVHPSLLSCLRKISSIIFIIIIINIIIIFIMIIDHHHWSRCKFPSSSSSWWLTTSFIKVHISSMAWSSSSWLWLTTWSFIKVHISSMAWWECNPHKLQSVPNSPNTSHIHLHTFSNHQSSYQNISYSSLHFFKSSSSSQSKTRFVSTVPLNQGLLALQRWWSCWAIKMRIAMETKDSW